MSGDGPGCVPHGKSHSRNRKRMPRWIYWRRSVSLKIFMNIDQRATVTGFRRLGKGLLSLGLGHGLMKVRFIPGLCCPVRWLLVTCGFQVGGAEQLRCNLEPTLKPDMPFSY